MAIFGNSKYVFLGARRAATISPSSSFISAMCILVEDLGPSLSFRVTAVALTNGKSRFLDVRGTNDARRRPNFRIQRRRIRWHRIYEISVNLRLKLRSSSWKIKFPDQAFFELRPEGKGSSCDYNEKLFALPRVPSLTNGEC